MSKIYLTEDKRRAIVIRDLMSIDIDCGLLTMGYIMPQISNMEKDAVQCIKGFCKKHIVEQLKKCEFFSNISNEEEKEETSSHKVSYITKATLGALCVFAGEQAEVVLAELQRLGICKTIQEALKTGKHVLLV